MDEMQAGPEFWEEGARRYERNADYARDHPESVTWWLEEATSDLEEIQSEAAQVERGDRERAERCRRVAAAMRR
jgi:hypothetical protein